MSDQPITGEGEDWLSLSREASALAAFIAGCVTPMTIAVQGDWGSGKTSLLRMIEEQLQTGTRGRGEGRQRVEVIRFETWQYAQFGGGPALPLSLLSMLARRLSPPGIGSQAVNMVRRLASPVANAAVRHFTGGLSELGDLPGVAEPVDFAEECDKLRDELERTVAAKLKEGVDRLVVLIDDLDRVEPALAVDILQTIKMFLDLNGCVFVLALDFAVVQDGIEAKFGIRDRRKARAFFDKIIQLPFQVPVAKYDTGGFIQHLLASLNEPGLDGDATNTLIALSRNSITANPRAIKRVMNSLHLTRLLAAETFDGLGTRRADGLVALFGLLCLQARFPEAYDRLLAREDAAAAVRELGSADPAAAVQSTQTWGLVDEHDDSSFAEFGRALAKAAAGLLTGDGANFDQVLDLTRSTSVGEQGSNYKLSATQRSVNQEMMQAVLQDCQAALPGVALTLKPTSGGGLEIVAEPRPGMSLSLEHGLTWLGLAATAAAPADRVALLALPNAHEAADRTVHLWREQVFTTTPMWKRRDLLRAGPEHFRAAWQALQEGAAIAA